MGYLILRHHRLTTLKFSDATDFERQRFHHQNDLRKLGLSIQQRSEGPSPCFATELIG
jgi:hypothetical protein